MLLVSGRGQDRLSVSVWIQAHPSRASLHRRLVSALDSLPYSLSVHESNPPNPWAGYKLLMERAVEAKGPSHFVVLQDDVIPCKDFTLAVIDVISDRPENILSLWVGGLRQPTTKHYRQAQINGERWVQIHFSDIHHCVALVWPRSLAETFLEWASTSMLPGDGRNQQSDDAIVGAFARRTKNYFWATIPCLVEHDDDVVSTINRPRGDAGRRAISFAGS